jgi:hypothetical protein
LVVSGIKTRRNHSKPILLDVHPFSDVVYNQLSTDLAVNHVLCRLYPLDIITGRSFRPVADIVSTIDTHSRLSGAFT